MKKSIYKSKHQFIAILVGLLLSTALWGQVNTESMRKANLEPGLHFSAGATLAYLEGNSTIFQTRLNGRLDWVQSWGRSFLVANQKISSKDDQLFINQGFLHIRLVKPLKGGLETELFVQQEYNEFINLTSRSLIGSGLRIQFSNSDALALIAGIGFMFEQERLDIGSNGLGGDPVHGAIAKLVRSTNYAVITWDPSPLLTLQSTTYCQVDVTRLNDYRILTKTRADLHFSKNLSLNLNLNMRYDNEPPGDVIDLDLEFSQGLTYRF